MKMKQKLMSWRPELKGEPKEISESKRRKQKD